MELSELAVQNNRVLKELVRDLRAKYKPASIRFVVTLAKQVLDSAKNENGLPLYPMQWSSDFIDLPVIANQKQPTVTPEEVRAVVQDGPDCRPVCVPGGLRPPDIGSPRHGQGRCR
jgi:hypothetical protein